MKVKTLSLLLIIAAMLFIGGVWAADPTPEPTSASQNIAATVPPYTITITAPEDITSWELQRGINNERDVGPVYISTTAPSGYLMTLKMRGNHDRLWSDTLGGLDTGMFWSALTPPISEPSWIALSTGDLMVANVPATTTPTAIPVRLRQFVTTDDADGSYSVVLTYTLSVASTT